MSWLTEVADRVCFYFQESRKEPCRKKAPVTEPRWGSLHNGLLCKPLQIGFLAGGGARRGRDLAKCRWRGPKGEALRAADLDPTPPLPQSDWEPARPFRSKEAVSIFSARGRGSPIDIARTLKHPFPSTPIVLPFSQALGGEARSDKVITALYCFAEKLLAFDRMPLAFLLDVYCQCVQKVSRHPTTPPL